MESMRRICIGRYVYDDHAKNGWKSRCLYTFCCPFVIMFHWIFKIFVPCIVNCLWRASRIFWQPCLGCINSMCGGQNGCHAWDKDFPPDAPSLGMVKDGKVKWKFSSFNDQSTADEVNAEVKWIKAAEYVKAMKKRNEMRLLAQGKKPDPTPTCKDVSCPPSRTKCIAKCNIDTPFLFAGPDGGINPHDVCQGSLGDCWLIAAFACMAEFPGAIRRIFQTKEYNPHGWYSVKLYDARVQKWKKIWIDDYLPVKTAGDDSWQPVFAAPDGGCELWVALLEKAFAKFCNGYTGLKGGHMMWAFQAMTGDNIFMLMLDDENKWERWNMCSEKDKNGKPKMSANPRDDCGWRGKPEAVDDVRAFRLIQQYDKNKAIIGCSKSNNGEDKDDESGIVAGHAYTVIAVVETTEGGVLGTDHKKNWLLQLRNPWGSFEWKGKWSDTHECWNLPENKQEKKKCGWNGDDENDGMFWIEWEDFKKKFNKVQICDRTTWDDIQLEIDEELGCCGIATGCCKTTGDYWCCCKGMDRIYFGRHTSDELVEIDKGCCCWKKKEVGTQWKDGKKIAPK